MKDPILVGHGDGGDVAPTPDGSGWTVAWVPVLGGQRQPLRLSRYDWYGTLLDAIDVPTDSSAGGISPRMVPAGDFLWLAHHARIDGIYQVVLRRVHADGTYTTDGVYGASDGPLALSGDWLAWQSAATQKVYGRKIIDPHAQTVVLRDGYRPTGLAYLDGSYPVFWDENRMSIPGMYNPVRSYGLVVGEGYSGGVACRMGGAPGTLLPWQLTQTPRGLQVCPRGPCASTHWNSDGVWLLLFSAADVLAAARSTIADRPDLLGEGATE